MDLKLIVNKGEILNLKVNPPTLDELNSMNKVVQEYIKNNGLIVYGGTAIAALLKAKGISPDPDKFYDYDFFSPNFIKDSIAIANEFFSKGYKYVRRVNALHPDTVRIGVDFSKEFLADITYIPSKIYSKIPTITINKIKYAHPQFLKIDLYRSVTNPHTNIFRWKKSYLRLTELERQYPITGIRKAVKEPKEKFTPPFPALIGEYIKEASDSGLIAIGLIPFNLFRTLVEGEDEKKKLSDILGPTYDFYSIDPQSAASKLFKFLSSKISNIHLEIRSYFPYLGILEEKTSLLINGAVIVNIYNIGYRCISYKIINNIKVASYHHQLEFLYSMYIITAFLSEESDSNRVKEKELYIYAIVKLQEYFEKYNKKHKTIGTEANNPFEIFMISCQTQNREDANLATFKKTFMGQIGYPGYRPEKRLIDPNTIHEIYNNNYLGEEKTSKSVTLEQSIIESLDDDKEEKPREKKNRIVGIRRRSRSKSSSSRGRKSVNFNKKAQIQEFNKRKSVNHCLEGGLKSSRLNGC